MGYFANHTQQSGMDSGFDCSKAPEARSVQSLRERTNENKSMTRTKSASAIRKIFKLVTDVGNVSLDYGDKGTRY